MERTRTCTCFETTFSFSLTQHFSGRVVRLLSSDYGPGRQKKWLGGGGHLLPCEKVSWTDFLHWARATPWWGVVAQLHRWSLRNQTCGASTQMFPFHGVCPRFSRSVLIKHSISLKVGHCDSQMLDFVFRFSASPPMARRASLPALKNFSGFHS